MSPDARLRAAARPESRAAPEGRAGDDGRAIRAAWALWAVAAALVAARAALAFVPTMHLWSLNLQRFLGPAWAWLPWALAALALLPSIARRALPALEWLGDRIARGHWPTQLAAMALAATLVGGLPDRVRFVGDFLLRQGTVEEAEKPGVMFPQALPLDVLLHYRLPLMVERAGFTNANGAARALGAIEAALLAALAFAVARALRSRGAGAATSAALVFFCGALGMMTGYSKAFSELVLVTAAVAASGLETLRGEPRGRGLLPLGIAVALGVMLHRSALSLVPALAVAWLVWWRAAGPSAWRRPAVLAGIAIPLVAIAVMAPRIIADVRTWDTVHFEPAEDTQAGGPLRAALAGGRALDLLNLLIVLAPLSLAAPAAGLLLRRVRGEAASRGPGGAPPTARPGSGAGVFLLALALPWVLGAPFIHPAQGLFRDWDDFAAAGAAIAIVSAWVAGEAIGRAPRHAWIGVGLVLAAAAPSLQWLAVHADFQRGLERVRAFVTEPPRRTPAERAKTWDYLGITAYRHERWTDAADAFANAAETGPSYRILLEWAMSATNAGDLEGAESTYHKLLALHPDAAFGWLGLGAVASRLAAAAPPGAKRDAYVTESRHAAHQLLDLQPGNADGVGLLQYLDRTYGAMPDSSRR
jgi:tetratricopeptide (TPR) repeat protein